MNKPVLGLGFWVSEVTGRLEQKGLGLTDLGQDKKGSENGLG